jgi:hypothetical protein
VRGRASEDKRRQVELALEQARYEVGRARRQYDAVDPDNRLVAAELEKRWNERGGRDCRSGACAGATDAGQGDRLGAQSRRQDDRGGELGPHGFNGRQAEFGEQEFDAGGIDGIGRFHAKPPSSARTAALVNSVEFVVGGERHEGDGDLRNRSLIGPEAVAQTDAAHAGSSPNAKCRGDG